MHYAFVALLPIPPECVCLCTAPNQSVVKRVHWVQHEGHNDPSQLAGASEVLHSTVSRRSDGPRSDKDKEKLKTQCILMEEETDSPEIEAAGDEEPPVATPPAATSMRLSEPDEVLVGVAAE